LHRPIDEFRNIMSKGFYSKRHFTALNMVYLLLGVTGLVFFVYAGWYLDHADLPAAKTPNAATAEIMTYRRLFLLMISVVELGIGVYIAQSAQKLALFFQCLSFMLLMATHILFAYAFFEMGPDAPVLIRSAAYTGFISVLLHVFVLAGRLPFDIKIVRRTDGNGH
jgi:hypothetical protein